jgi:hypothetical protein
MDIYLLERVEMCSAERSYKAYKTRKGAEDAAHEMCPDPMKIEKTPRGQLVYLSGLECLVNVSRIQLFKGEE